MKELIKIALIQSDIHWENIDANLNMFSDKLAQVASDSDIVVLPEMFSTGFSMHSKEMAEKMNGKTLDWMKAQSQKFGFVLTGSFICKEEEKFYNRLVWMQPDGKFQHYDKRHLFRMAEEDNFYTSGKNRIIVEYEGWKICPLVCYDLRFPAFSRNIDIESGATGPVFDILIYVAEWPAKRNDAWKSLLVARAIENQCYVCGVNRVGVDGLNISYDGSSAIINAKGIKLSTAAKGEEEIIYSELNMPALDAFRDRFPVHLDADSFKINEK